jgi:undecaprenyl pyrophosphate phosphatase UppP
MTTFQALIDAFLRTLVQILPISERVPETALQGLMHWSEGTLEILCLVFCMGGIAFLIFFRFDWMGIFSAFFRSLFQPLSLRAESRSLDQHTLMLLILVFVPALLIRYFITPLLPDEIFNHPLVNAALTALVAFGLYFSHRWNKRIHGLNHLKLADGFLIGALGLLSVHPAIPYVGMLWIGFALCNYHYEAVFKYSMMAVGLTLFAGTFELLHRVGFRNSVDTVGHLNCIAILVVSFGTFWMGLENLQKNLNEGTYKTFQWLNSIFAIFFIVFYFLRDV